MGDMEKFSKSYEPGDIEPEIYAMWERSGVFEPDSAKSSRKTYSIVLPPPNANGNLHIGHGLTVAVEDALIRYHRLRGDYTWFIPGADHAGFETWVVYEKKLQAEGKSRFDYSRDELYAQVWDFVAEQRGNMELQLRALGASLDWGAMTFTLDDKVVDRVYQTFEKMWKEGLIYRGKKLVNFCTYHQTAFADIEVVYKEEKTPLYYLKYGPFVLATTRPETKFGDTGVAVNPNDARYKKWVGKTVTVEGVNGPFKVKVVADEAVDSEFGTGVVKITPAHDFNDWETGQRHGLQAVQVIDEEGRMTELAGRFAGMKVEEARKAVVEAMEEKGLIEKIDENYVNKVPHCYKCGTVIEPMLREQWFVDVKPLAKRAIEALEKGKIKFYPANKKKVLINYYKGLKDWNISRQIPWGIAIPAYRLKDAAESLSSLDSSPGKIPPAGDFSREFRKAQKDSAASSTNSDWVFSTEVDKTEIEVDGKRYERDNDTFDTWFSSSHWPIVCTEGREGFYPLSVMETGADILFAWVARMIMMGLYATGEVPFRDVYLHGLVLDEKGQKMSKSKGNVMNPMEMVGKYGSDAFRLGIIASRSAGMNQAFSESKVVAGRNLCNKLWNVARLVQGIVDEGVEEATKPLSSLDSPPGKIPPAGDFSREFRKARKDSVASSVTSLLSLTGEKTRSEKLVSASSLPYSTENMGEDWICREIDETRQRVEKMYAEYRFAEVEEALYDLIWNKYADWFLESQKMFKNTSLLRLTLTDILVMLHPLAPFATEAIWQTLSWTKGMCINAEWPSGLVWDDISAESFERVRSIVLEVRRVYSALSEASGGERYSLLYSNDGLVDDNQVLIMRLTGADGVVPIDVPRGMRLAIAGREVYLDVPEGVVKKYRGMLEERILAVGREVDVLNLRMSNAAYVEKAPKELVEETKRAIEEKQGLIERLKGELKGI